MTAISLYTRHLPLASLIAGEFFRPGYAREDMRQEARLALWTAVRTYDPERGTFPTFARLVIRAHFATLLKSASRDVRKANDYAEGDETLAILPHAHQVVDEVMNRETLRILGETIPTLPPFQRECVYGVASGKPYAEIGDPKAVDNALFRARRTLRKALAA
jgi:RNA polymerase sigma factor (sigma-70 family)